MHRLGMREVGGVLQRKTEPKVSRGILVFLISLAALFVLAVPMQNAWGMWGLALTELMLLVIAIIFARIFRWEFREVFPLKVPSFRQILGVLVLWFASYVAVYVTSVTLYYLFPAGMGGVNTALTDFFTSVPKPLALLVVAVMPGICEEVLHRGLIQFTFRGKSKSVTILAMAVIFGLFHLDLYRFVGTALLGGVLTYIMVETGNLLLPILLHVLNNAVSTSLAFLSGPDAGLSYVPLSAIGFALIVAAMVPFLFVLGSRLLARRGAGQKKPATRKAWIFATLLALLCVVGGTFLVTNGSSTPIFETSFSEQVPSDSSGHRLPFTVEQAGIYHIDLTIEGGEGLLTSIAIQRADGDEVYSLAAGSVTVQAAVVSFVAGDHLYVVEYDHNGVDYTPVKVAIRIY